MLPPLHHRLPNHWAKLFPQNNTDALANGSDDWATSQLSLSQATSPTDNSTPLRSPRSARCFALGLTVAADYKINFRENPWFADSIADIHARNAAKLFELLRTNGGLYLKIGQAIAMQSAILPPEFQKMFARMFDDAPQNSWEEIRKVIMEDFGGRTPEEVFGVSFEGDPNAGVMERTARASASVAQVHWARLKDGREVAIKVQKQEDCLSSWLGSVVVQGGCEDLLLVL